MDARVDALLSEWKRVCLEGRAPSAEEHCRGCPELLDELRESIKELGNLDDKKTVDFLIPADTTGRPDGRGGVPERIGKYQVVRSLGKGGQGSAYLAFDPELERHVVIKLYHAPACEESGDTESILREG